MIIRVTVKEDKVFRRDGYDVHIDKEISISQAVLGTQIEINNLEGKRMVTVPPGISTGNRIKLGNQGIRKLAPNQSQRGDFYVNIVVKIPKVLSERQREIFEELRALEDKGFNGKKGVKVEKKVENMSTEEGKDKEEESKESFEESESETKTKEDCKKGFKNRFKKWY